MFLSWSLTAHIGPYNNLFRLLASVFFLEVYDIWVNQVCLPLHQQEEEQQQQKQQKQQKRWNYNYKSRN